MRGKTPLDEERLGVQGEPQAHGVAGIAPRREPDGPLQVFGADSYRESAALVSDLDRRPYHLSTSLVRWPGRALRELRAPAMSGTLLGLVDRTDHPTGTNRPRRFSGPMFAGRRVGRKGQRRPAIEKHTANTPKYGSGVKRTDARGVTRVPKGACGAFVD